MHGDLFNCIWKPLCGCVWRILSNGVPCGCILSEIYIRIWAMYVFFEVAAHGDLLENDMFSPAPITRENIEKGGALHSLEDPYIFIKRINGFRYPKPRNYSDIPNWNCFVLQLEISESPTTFGSKFFKWWGGLCHLSAMGATGIFFHRVDQLASGSASSAGSLRQLSKLKTEGVSWPCKFKRSNEGCGSHADEGDFGAEGEGIQEAQMLRGDEYKRGKRQHLSFGSHHLHTRFIFGRDSERLARDHSESRRSGGSGEGPQIGDSAGDRTQNLWFHKRIKLELELGLLIEIDLGSRAWIRIGDRLVRGSIHPARLWVGMDMNMPVAALPVEFCMPDIKRYTGIGCPRIHLQLYSTVMQWA
ncbi:hypothetical protein CK203_059273 [Vitis vinifera]|uniref:Uncharacterized protein n=1 Tax=Vitis vinifera TaxID=29760 RepID=A0A438FSR0_VITVI|nr:hypothetical protein CK203_059273 [Vitis vinifera]